MAGETGFCQEIYAVCPWREACEKARNRLRGDITSHDEMLLLNRLLGINCVGPCIVESALGALEYAGLREVIATRREFTELEFNIPAVEEA